MEDLSGVPVALGGLSCASQATQGGTEGLTVENCVCAVPPPAAPNAAPYCTANVQPGVTWGNGDGTYSGIMNVVSILPACGLLRTHFRNCFGNGAGTKV